MLCQKCSKTLEWSWKEFTRWLRNHPETDAYICKECLTSERNRKHGESKTLLYTHWKSMFVRTKGQSLEANKKYYLDKKIVVCPEWRNYENFRTWALANGFVPGLELSRKNHDKNYEPANCQWLGKSEHRKYDHAANQIREQKSDIQQHSD